MQKSRRNTLILTPTLTVRVYKDGSINLTKKFIEGVEEYLQYWDGAVKVLLEPSQNETDNLDNTRVDPSSLPFKIEVIDFKSEKLVEHIRDASVVHCGASHRQNHISKLCNALNIASVYGTEYTLKTRMQIINSEDARLAARMKRHVWEVQQELKQTYAIWRATGVQCNGTPTFDVYKRVNSRAHLLFDARTRSQDLIDQETLQNRFSHFLSGQKIRLLFSGRLAPMKGAGSLPAIADALRRRGLNFEMFICGDGPLRENIESEIAQRSLSDHVSMLGVLDFRTELVPFTKEKIDLFVCTHVQGDPSCTYLETFACGVPIVGFANEAFEGIVKRVDAAWAVPINDVEAIAEKIVVLSQTRDSVALSSQKACEFAAQHTFEKTFERRIEHFRECMQTSNSKMAL